MFSPARSLLLGALVAASLALPPAALGAAPGSIVVNGDFSQPALSGGMDVFEQIPGWGESTGCGIEVWSAGFTNTPEGEQAVELGSNCPSSIHQELTTVPGTVYRVSYSFAARPGTPAWDNELLVEWDDEIKDVTGTDDPAYAERSFLVTAETTSATLRFTDIGDYNTVGSLLALVSVVPNDAEPPVIAVEDRTVEATGPDGALVDYRATATDNDPSDPTPGVSCTPASGTWFAIGSTTVSCSAQDAAGNRATASFEVLVEGAPAQIAALAAKIQAISTRGIFGAIDRKLGDASAALAGGDHADEASTCGKLAVVEHQIESNAVLKTITPAQAAGLSADVHRIRAVIGC